VGDGVQLTICTESKEEEDDATDISVPTGNASNRPLAKNELPF
jgi:hypothetical protein